MWVADDVDGRTRHLRELVTSTLHGLGELLVLEARERVVPEGVEPDCHARGHQLEHLLAPQAGVLRIRPGVSEEPLGGAVSLRRRHVRHRHAEPVQRGRPSRRSGDQRGKVGHPVVPGTLEALEVERERPVERGAAQEEGPRDAEPVQRRCGDRRVGREVVVERDRDREALTTPPGSDCLEQAVGRDDVVVPDDVAYLALEELRLMRRHELASRIARTPIHTVVHERDAGLATRQPEEEHERDAHGHADHARDRPYESLRERRMSAHLSHGRAGEVVPPAQAVDGFEAVEREWDELAQRSWSIFSTALWSRLWWEHYGADRELLLHATRADDGSLAAILPLYAWRGRFPRVLRFLGHGPGDELGPVHAGDAEGAARVVRSTLDELHWDVFLGEQLPGDEGWPESLGGRLWRREASPSLDLPASWDEYLAARSANFREQLRRRSAALGREGAVVTRSADATTLDEDLDALFALHRARWGTMPTDFADTPFHREVARGALDRGWLRLWMLELDGRPVAAWHGFQVGSVCSYYQAGRDPALERHSVGFLLMAHSIRAAIAEGATEYRFGRGDEAFKSRFTAVDPGLVTVTLTRGVLGGAAERVGRAARAMRRRGRSR